MLKALVLIFAMGVAPLAGAESQSGEDADLKQAIQHDLVEEGIRTLDIQVLDGTVTLTGEVDNAYEKTRAEEIVLDHNEVESVQNEIVVASDRSDESIAADVSQKLRNYVHYSIFDNVSLRVIDGVVTLMGDVTWGYKADEMAKMAARVPGVLRVENEIDVLPSSSNDEQLRQALASQIYGDATFFPYATQPSPPIHIIVENGRVTLTGVVNSEIQKRRAEQIARQTFGVFSVDNQLTVDAS